MLRGVNSRIRDFHSLAASKNLKELYLPFRAHTAPTRNWRFSASHDSFVVAQTFVLRMNICGKNRQLLVAANRYGQV